MKKILFTLALSAMLLTGCEKDEPETTSATTSNSNSNSNSDSDSDLLDSEDEIVETFTCKIDGITRTFDSRYINYNFLFSDENSYDDSYTGNPSGKLIRITRFDDVFDCLKIELFKDLDDINPPQTFTTNSDSVSVFTDKELEISYTDLAQLEETYFGVYSNISFNKSARASLTVTSTDNDVIEGNFEGVLYFENNIYSNYDSVKVTDGKFKIKLERETTSNITW